MKKNEICPIPIKRKKPLPWERPKSKKEDPKALRRIEEIMNHRNYNH